MKLGKVQVLKIIKKNELGCSLSDGEEEAFVPEIFTEKDWEEGEHVEVFIYQEGEKLMATTEKPFAQVGEFAVMSCVQVLDSGAFVDWGIIKDLFVPYKQQRMKMEVGKPYLIYVYIDEQTGLVTGTNKIKNIHIDKISSLEKGEKVDLILTNRTPLGWNVVINQKFFGLLYESDVYKYIQPLTEDVGYIKLIREDGKIDVCLQPEGYENIDVFKQKIIKKLNENYGILFLTDASTPGEIKQELEMSKKNFKKAIGGLYRDKKINILTEKIQLIQSGSEESLSE